MDIFSAFSYSMMTMATIVSGLTCNSIYSRHIHVCTCASDFLIRFEAWVKLAQQWLVCVPLGIHVEPINKELMLLVTI